MRDEREREEHDDRASAAAASRQKQRCAELQPLARAIKHVTVQSADGVDQARSFAEG
jgi:hypothetical protein